MLGFKSKADKVSESEHNEARKKATDKAQENKPWLSLKNDKRKKLGLRIQAIIGNLIFSDNEIWAYYDIPTTIYDFLSDEQKVSYAYSLNAALGNIVRNQSQVIDCHLYCTTSPIDVNQWEQDYLEVSKTWHHRSGFEDFIQNQIAILSSNQLFEKRCYLGVCLGKRHAIDQEAINPFNVGFKEALRYGSKFLNNILLIEDKSVDKDELSHAQVKEHDLRTTIQKSALQGTPSTTEDLALAIKKILYPAMPCPVITLDDENQWDQGDIIQDLSGIIGPKNPRHVKIQQLVYDKDMGEYDFRTGYHATLTFKKIPDGLNIPYMMPWIYTAVFADVNTPFDVSCRFSLVPTEKIKKDIEKGINQTKDAIDNATGAGATPSPTVIDEMATATEMQREVETNKNKPWVSGTYRIGINAASEEELDNYCKAMMLYYDETMNGMKLVWTFHDQLDLLMESMPGDHLRENSFIQTTNLELLSVSGFNVLNEVGD